MSSTQVFFLPNFFFFYSSTAYSIYSPSLPATIEADPRFGYTVDLIYDGIVDLVIDKTTLPTIVLTDDQVSRSIID